MAERRTPRRGASGNTKARKRGKSRSGTRASKHIEDEPSTEPSAPARNADERAEAHSNHEAARMVAELEAQLAAAREVIDVLVSTHERARIASRPSAGATDRPTGAHPGQPPTDDPQLDILLRQRTRALIESEKQLEHKNTELERLNEMKVEFISIATHELRTPLTSIVGYLDLLEEGRFGDMPDDMERPMASLRRNAHRLKRLVDEMLDVSRIDSGRVTLFRTLSDLRDVIQNVVTDLQTQATSKRQELAIKLGEPPEIYVDIDKMRQIATKVIANAIRHTPEGGVITVMLDTAPPERFAGTWARLRVRATGIAIPIEMRSRIFEPFSSPHKARHHTSAGPDAAGLGLYIARGLIDLHGGLISVDSTEEHTEFTVLLPRSEPSPTD